MTLTLSGTDFNTTDQGHDDPLASGVLAIAARAASSSLKQASQQMAQAIDSMVVDITEPDLDSAGAGCLDLASQTGRASSIDVIEIKETTRDFT